jgi:hypothetical protein
MHQQKTTILKMNVSKLIRKNLISMHQQKLTILKMNVIKLLISKNLKINVSNIFSSKHYFKMKQPMLSESNHQHISILNDNISI